MTSEADGESPAAMGRLAGGGAPVPLGRSSGAADRICLRGLRVMAICGALPEEKTRAQPFTFDIDVETSLAAAGASDQLDDTIDYGALTDAIVAAVTAQHFTLLERLAHVVADTVLGWSQVDAVWVSVTKDRPPVPHPLATSGVQIRRVATDERAPR